MNKIQIIISVFFILIGLKLSSQSNQIMITKDYQYLSWNQFVEKLETEHQIHFFYHPEDVSEIRTSEITVNKPLPEFLDHLLSPYQLKVITSPEGKLLIVRDFMFKDLPKNFIQPPVISLSQEEKNQANPPTIANRFLETKDEFINKELIIGNKSAQLKNRNAIFNGQVLNAHTKEPVEGATLYFKELGSGVATDLNGKFSCSIKPGTYTLTVKSVASKEAKFGLQLYSDGEAIVYLENESYMLNEVVVSSEEIDPVRSLNMGIEKISTKNIKEIPLILGESDILKVAEMLSGVQSLGEGTAGFNVRGSPSDQNLFIINDVHVYNPAHLGGFFSAFNSDAIQNFTLYKSNIPVNYGGRLSSIFDISARQGNMKSFKANGGISPITGRVLLEGPIQKDKSSYLVSIRSTYSDWMLKMVKDIEIKNSQAQFGDVFTNFTFNLNPHNNLTFFTYYSKDFINFYQRTNYRYNNLGSSLKWRHSINANDFFDLVLVYSNYDFKEENTELGFQAYQQSNNLSHFELKTDIKITAAEHHKLNFGLNGILYHLDKGDFLPIEQSLILPRYFGTEKAIESGLFISDEWEISENFAATAGLRFSNYFYLGPQSVNSYIDGAPIIRDNLTGTMEYGKNEIITSHHNLDFRIAANYIINDRLSLKFSYNQLHQYLFMFSNTIAVSPNDKWKLSDYHIKPMSGDQFSVGIYSELFNGKLETSLETYFKNIHNLVEMRDGADLLINENPEQNTLQGELDAYGIEFTLKKPGGNLNGWINYTYSNTSVVVDDFFEENRINFGAPYPSNYDKPHAFNVVANLKLARRFSLSGNIVYSTGRPITYPSAIYYLDNIETLHYSKRNEYRIPDYFRIDFSVKMEGNLKLDKLAHGSWSFSVYNLLGRNNAYSVYFKSIEGKIKGYKMSVFGSPIISLTYNFKLGNYEN